MNICVYCGRVKPGSFCVRCAHDAADKLAAHLATLADVAAVLPKHYWPTLDDILALPATTDCPACEQLSEEA